jgi:hypothetical protein
MRVLTPFILATFVFFCGCGGIAGQPSRVVELPRPNSGTFTFAQAEAKKHLILSNTSSKRLSDWKNPYMGFAIHVTAEDTFTVYSAFYTPLFPDGIDPKQTFPVKGIQELERSIIQFGNPHGVLITSDRPLRESKAFLSLLTALFVPGIQLFYVSSE